MWRDWDEIEAAQAEADAGPRRRPAVEPAEPPSEAPMLVDEPASPRWGEPPPARPPRPSPTLVEVKRALLALIRHGNPTEQAAAAELAEVILDAER